MISRRVGVVLLAVAGVVAACQPVKPPPPLPAIPVPCNGTETHPSATNDPLRTGWYPNQPGLNPSATGDCAFGEQQALPVDGQVYARPVVDRAEGPNGTLVVATETNWVYGFDAATGQRLWARQLGSPWDPSEINCADLSPLVGITSTPAIDTNTHTAYVVAKTSENGVEAYRAHAVDLATGKDKPGFTVPTIEGAADNDPNAIFSATNHLQRPGLLLMNGAVYAAFGGLCDHPPYRGWVAGVNASTGALSALWTDEQGVQEPNPPAVGLPGGGIWQTGGHLIEDSGDIVLTAGNGFVPPVPTPGKPVASPRLGESAIRLHVLPTGKLQASDFWAPCNAQALADGDLDLGPGAPLMLSPEFGSNLMLVVSKAATLYLLDRTNFGGYQQNLTTPCADGSGNPGDKIVSAFNVPDTLLGAWATPAMWPGDDLVYLPYQPFYSNGKFTAFRIDGSGTPTISVAGRSSDDTYGFGSSSAIVTSDGKTPGTALVWIVRLPAGDGVGAELRAYDPVPSNGVIRLRGRWPIGTGNKFTTPTMYNGRMYVAARDGFVHVFGAVGQGSAGKSVPAPRPASAQASDPDG